MKRDPKPSNPQRPPLKLRRERIRELARESLDQVAGGGHDDHGKTGQCPATI